MAGSASVLLEGRCHARHWEEERHKLCVRKRKARFELHQGKQMVEIREKLADVNDDKAAHSLSTKNVHFSAFAGGRRQWRDICWQCFGKSWSSLREEKDDCFSSATSLIFCSSLILMWQEDQKYSSASLRQAPKCCGWSGQCVQVMCREFPRPCNAAHQGSALSSSEVPPVPGSDSFIPHPTGAVTTCCPWTWHPHGLPKTPLALRGRGVAGEEPEVTLACGSSLSSEP